MLDPLPTDRLGPVDHPYEPFPEAAVQGSVLDRFDEIARRFADRLAIQDCAASLTYEELAAMVARIAASTARATAGRAGPVAILLASEARYPAATFGVLGAGRAYVPLDAEAPIERNRTIVSEIGVCAILSTGDLLRDARAMAASEAVVIDIVSESAAKESLRPVRSGPNDLAYIVYTSGSTGASKSVAFCHRNALQKALQYTNTVHISFRDRLLLARPLNVSAADRSIYGALLNGASLHILPPPRLGAAGLAREIAARSITVYHTAPTLLRRIADALAPGERLESVRVAALGGERVEWHDVDLCRRCFSVDVCVYTGLNSTESAAGFCQWFIDDSVRATSERLPVGRPLPDRRVAILGEDGNTVADGDIGEIVVTSRRLALGYWRGFDQTVESFPSDPNDPESRVLRTGDLGLRRADGLIEFVGRKDDVVKLHGRRIDCTEIESAINALRQVSEAAVVVHKDDCGTARMLVAYAALRPGNHGLLGRHLQGMLAKSLPHYMVPGRVVIVDQLPRLPSMKVDRVRLTEMDAARAVDVADRASDPLVDAVACIFETVLELNGASADDNVASLGGDSLQAMSVIAEVERRFGVVMPDDLVADDPTIRAIAGRLRALGTPQSRQAEMT